MPDILYFPEHEASLLVATEQELLDFANDVREAGGGEAIPALLPSYPQNPNSCLIANALNFGCRVLPIGTIEVEDAEDGHGVRISEWFMYVDDSDIAERIAERVKGASFEQDYDEDTPAIRLPVHIGNAADAFDLNLAFAAFDATSTTDSN